jgi:uncharacterized LabA/DUF88 family protein
MANIFKAVDKDVEELAKDYASKIKILESIFDKKTIIYIDYANVIGTYFKRKWNIDLNRAIKLFKSFTTVEKVRFYYGTIEGDADSEKRIQIAKDAGYEVHTKCVKKITMPFDVSSIPPDSAVFLKKFIKRPLLRALTKENIEDINRMLLELNKSGTTFLEDKKCNFDVEMSLHMLQDCEQSDIKNFVIWSSDSDFEYPIRKLMENKKIVTIWGTKKTIAHELQLLTSEGVRIYTINGLRNLICRDDERSDVVV